MPSNPCTASPVLHVSSISDAISYYTGVLGCTEEFRFEERYAGMVLGKVHFHLSQGGGMFDRPVGGSNLYFFLDTPAEVDACYAEIVAKGGRVDKEPYDYPYGMRDFVAFDPDGNMLSFGAETQGS